MAMPSYGSWEFGDDYTYDPKAGAARFDPGWIAAASQLAGIAALVADQQSGRMIVAGQRTETVQDLVEEILRMDLLHDLAVDSLADADLGVTLAARRVRASGWR